MSTRNSLFVVTLLVAAMAAAGCATRAEAPVSDGEPAHVEEIEGSELHLVTLTARAAERLGIQTAPVTEAGGRLAVPYGAVFYDAEGGAWAYVEDGPLAYVRHALEIDVIEGEQAYLRDGPAPGTAVVSVGAAELFGTEFEVGH